MITWILSNLTKGLRPHFQRGLIMSKAIQEKQAQIEKLKSEIEELKKVVAGLYKPEIGELYFTLWGSKLHSGDSPEWESNALSIGEIYRTQEEAEKALDKKRAYIRMIDKIAELNASVGWVCDRSDLDQEKAHMHFNCSNRFRDEVDTCEYTTAQDLPRDVYFSPDVAEIVVRECSEDFKIWLGVVE